MRSGSCPLCGRDLKEEGDLLVCPQGDYKARGTSFEARYAEFNQEILRVGTLKANGAALLRDLQQLNIQGKE